MNPEDIALQSCLPTAVTLLASPAVDLTSFGLALVSAGFITQSALGGILSPLGLTSSQKAMQLLQCVSAQVKTNPKKYYESYLTILKDRPPLHTLHSQITEKHAQLTQGSASTNPPAAIKTREPTGEKKCTLRAGKEESFDCSEYGFKLHVPNGALPETHSECTIRVQVIPSGQHKLPEKATLVSAMYEISCPVKLRKPVQLEMQHCAIIRKDEQKSSLTFVKVQNSHFQPIEGGEFSLDSSYATISLQSFSIFAIILRYFGYDTTPSINCYTLVYVSPVQRNEWEIFCTIIKNLKPLITEVKELCADRKICGEFTVEFESDEITFQFTFNEIELSSIDWDYYDTHGSSVHKHDVDIYDGRGNPSACVFRVTWKRGDRNPDRIKLKLLGASSRRNYCQINLAALETRGTHKRAASLGPRDLSRLYKFLKLAAPGWRKIGEELDFTFEELEAIPHMSGLYSVDDYFQKLLHLWLKRTPERTTTVILAAALESAGEGRLANELVKEFQ